MGGYGSGGHNKTHNAVEDYFRLDSFVPISRVPALPYCEVQNNYNGKTRVYFRCPSCYMRVRFLYARSARFTCRKCARLNYVSQQMSEDVMRAYYKARKLLRNKLHYTKDFAPIDMACLCVPKPKGMHTKTYHRYMRQFDELICQQERELCHRALAVTGAGARGYAKS